MWRIRIHSLGPPTRRSLGCAFSVSLTLWTISGVGRTFLVTGHPLVPGQFSYLHFACGPHNQILLCAFARVSYSSLAAPWGSHLSCECSCSSALGEGWNVLATSSPIPWTMPWFLFGSWVCSKELDNLCKDLNSDWLHPFFNPLFLYFKIINHKNFVQRLFFIIVSPLVFTISTKIKFSPHPLYKLSTHSR